MTRKPIPKQVRQQVYNKYYGHCAYCGCTLDIKDMQVDHLESVYSASMQQKEVNDTLDNYMPSCRACNFYKGTMTLKQFRSHLLNTLQDTCRASFQVKLAMKYGMLNYKPWDGEFYFEKIARMDVMMQEVMSLRLKDLQDGVLEKELERLNYGKGKIYL